MDDEHPLDLVAEQRQDRVDDAVTDDDLVRVGAGADGDAGERPGHRPGLRSVEASVRISAATSCGVRPAVSTRSVATAS